MKRLIKKTQNISNIENNAFSRLRKITADAYDWVKERAEHIQDKNPDFVSTDEDFEKAGSFVHDKLLETKKDKRRSRKRKVVK